jgi:aspartate/methionine/tyrosine aminotransferase
MKIEQFEMERMQSTWENVVEFNLSESGVHPLSLSEFVEPAELDDLIKLGLGYSQTNGTTELREAIAALYPGARTDQILFTAGSSESNFLLMWSRVEPGDEVVFMQPNYMQMWGLARAFGAKVKPFRLRESLGWGPDLDELRKLVTKKTKLIIVTNPNNPTGAVLSREAMETIVELAGRAGAWIVADEVYQGAEVDGPPTESFWGKYDRLFVVNGLSKAYGLPGLRVGWMVGPADAIARTWPYHDYTTISPTVLSDRLARLVLKPGTRERILARTRGILRSNLPLIEEWLRSQDGVFEFIPPRAGAIVFARYGLKINSTALVQKLIRERSVLVVPGDHFLMDGYLRLGYGDEPATLREGLERIGAALRELKG